MPPPGGVITITTLLHPAQNDPISDLPGGEAYAAALRAGCETLLEFQLIEASEGADPMVTEYLAWAIAALRLALFQLRIARAPDSSPLTFGFVMGGEPDRRA